MKPEAPYSIGDVAELTGIGTSTLRAWESRYELVVPTRTASAYRAYTEEDVEVFRRMRVLVDSGVPARRAARMAGDPASVPSAAAPPDQATPPGSALSDHWSLTRIAARFDPVALQGTLDEAFALGSVELVLDEWLMPSLAVLGAGWKSGEVDIAGEHFVSAAVMRRLAALFEASGSRGPRVLVGLPPECRHEIPALAFAVCLRRAGLDVLYLGADVPIESWPAVVRASDPRAAVISAALPRDVESATTTAEVLHASGVSTVYVGGSAANGVPGATPLPTKLSVAANLVSAALT